MIAATAADIDGVGIIFSQKAYWDWHHVAAHGLFSALLFAAVLTAFPQPRRVLAFFVYLALAHLHLLMDYFGSGPGWPIYYLWPVSNFKIVNPNASDLFSWQNTLCGGMLLAWTIAIAWRCKRTPLEAIMPRLDAQLVGRSPQTTAQS